MLLVSGVLIMLSLFIPRLLGRHDSSIDLIAGGETR
jgi:hypothetical protein